MVCLRDDRKKHLATGPLPTLAGVFYDRPPALPGCAWFPTVPQAATGASWAGSRGHSANTGVRTVWNGQGWHGAVTVGLAGI